MGFFDKVKDILNEEDDDDFEDFYDDSASSFNRASKSRSVEAPLFEREERSSERPARRQKSDKVVNINTTAQFQVVLVKPEKYEEAAAIADHLNTKRSVVLNLESTNRDIARRLLDFLSGVAYANNGQIKRVANSTYIITPYNVDVMGDLIDELENNGMFM
ncbi:MAG: cell division protein SepF [Ruminococcaceae bacterium]|nr:cell division protein SepF [Oscillospiraceae bacterium]